MTQAVGNRLYGNSVNCQTGIARSSALKERALDLRKDWLTTDQQTSMGLKSGEYGGR